MKYQRFGKNYVVRIDRGEDILAVLTDFARTEGVGLATVQGLGACDHVRIGAYNVEAQVYRTEVFDGEMEMTSLIGSITTMHGEAYLHLHATFGLADYTVVGGHLNEARISATGEIFITVLDGETDRFKDEATGLNLLDLNG